MGMEAVGGEQGHSVQGQRRVWTEFAGVLRGSDGLPGRQQASQPIWIAAPEA